MSARTGLEIAGFTGLALALHVAVFGWSPGGSAGLEGAGDGGEARISLLSASADVAEMVARFDAPEVPAAALATPLPPPEFRVPQVALPALAPLPAPDLTPPPAPKAEAEPPAPPKVEAPNPARKTEPPPKTKPRATATHDSAGQRAAGSGGGGIAGNNGTAQETVAGTGKAVNLRAQWGATIRARIERAKRYPSAAGRVGGTVTVRLSVTRGGDLASVALAASSGNAALDAAALEAVRRAGRFPAAPKGLSEPAYAFSLTIRFSR
ncbi:energy transducer TonB family protein [Paenirhodobacter hankyongi]|uniref:Energy transducer TonB n=1 Tax=Paenirhodobacter hankyongi TaxID=2294033 RepID=A0A421BLF7_9RHOB|nr:TonB family protein [Sinirhodobacter hankyongi]RLL63874.1 energy transducer TonB [Sinirhodobacter hankyongi]